MNSTKIGVFKKGNKVGFCGFLKGKNSLALESNFLFPFLGNFSDKPLEGQFSDEEVSLN